MSPTAILLIVTLFLLIGSLVFNVILFNKSQSVKSTEDTLESPVVQETPEKVQPISKPKAKKPRNMDQHTVVPLNVTVNNRFSKNIDAAVSVMAMEGTIGDISCYDEHNTLVAELDLLSSNAYIYQKNTLVDHISFTVPYMNITIRLHNGKTCLLRVYMSSQQQYCGDICIWRQESNAFCWFDIDTEQYIPMNQSNARPVNSPCLNSFKNGDGIIYSRCGGGIQVERIPSITLDLSGIVGFINAPSIHDEVSLMHRLVIFKDTVNPQCADIYRYNLHNNYTSIPVLDDNVLIDDSVWNVYDDSVSLRIMDDMTYNPSTQTTMMNDCEICSKETLIQNITPLPVPGLYSLGE